MRNNDKGLRTMLLFALFVVATLVLLFCGCEPCIPSSNWTDPELCCSGEIYDLGDGSCCFPEPCCVDSEPDAPCGDTRYTERVGTFCCYPGRTP